MMEKVTKPYDINIMKHKTVFKNNEEELKPFYVHTGAAGVGKSFLINAISVYVKKI